MRFYGSYSMILENRAKKKKQRNTSVFYSEDQTEQKYADIYIAKKYNSDACNANQWYLYNSIAD